MRASRYGVAAALAAATLLLSAGCGSHGVPPKTWAGRVCTALKPWTSTITTLTTQTQTQMKSVTTPDQAKVTLVDLLDQEASASAKARDRLLAAGTPDVPNGADIAGQFRSALASAEKSYATARDSIRKLSTDDSETFYDGVTTAIDTLNKQYKAGALDTSKVRSEQLQQAFDTVPECQ